MLRPGNRLPQSILRSWLVRAAPCFAQRSLGLALCVLGWVRFQWMPDAPRSRATWALLALFLVLVTENLEAGVADEEKCRGGEPRAGGADTSIRDSSNATGDGDVLADVLEHVLSLNDPAWQTSFGGLGLCPGTHGFFVAAARTVVDGNICEIGMGTGISAALLLMGSGDSPVHTFDLGSDTKRRISAYLNDRFEGRLRPHWGDFSDSVPASGVVCDLIFVDALHPADVIVSMDHLAHAGTQFLYHNGGAGEVKARDFLISTYPWEELATSDTARIDGKRAIYHLGRQIGAGLSTVSADILQKLDPWIDFADQSLAGEGVVYPFRFRLKNFRLSAPYVN